MKISRTWAMPCKDTLSIKPIRRLFYSYYQKGTVVVDPFARFCKLGTITNDLNPECPTTYHKDALQFLKELDSSIADFVIYDPPYSPRQIAECYCDCGKENFAHNATNMKYWADVKSEIARIIKPKGLCLCCGWNTCGLGSKRNFTLLEVLIVSHGGGHNDTLVTIEVKGASLFE